MNFSTLDTLVTNAQFALIQSFNASQVPPGIQIAITYAKTLGIVALGSKLYSDFSEHGELGDKAKKAAIPLIGLAVIAAPSIIAKLTGMDQNSPLLNLLGGWNFGF